MTSHIYHVVNPAQESVIAIGRFYRRIAFGVLPAFAFANAGVSLAGLSIGSFFEPLPLGILLGLFLGKQVGIFGSVWLGVRLGLCRLPSGVTWLQIYGVALLAGIGFTMSLFIATLAFAEPAIISSAKFAILIGSLLSGLVGLAWLRTVTMPRPRIRDRC